MEWCLVDRGNPVTFRLTYEITLGQELVGAVSRAERVTRLELECEPASADETHESVVAFLSAVDAERGAQLERWSAPSSEQATEDAELDERMEWYPEDRDMRSSSA